MKLAIVSGTVESYKQPKVTLVCVCGNEWSADPNDYFLSPENRVFDTCGNPDHDEETPALVSLVETAMVDVDLGNGVFAWGRVHITLKTNPTKADMRAAARGELAPERSDDE